MCGFTPRFFEVQVANQSQDVIPQPTQENKTQENTSVQSTKVTPVAQPTTPANPASKSIPTLHL